MALTGLKKTLQAVLLRRRVLHGDRNGARICCYRSTLLADTDMSEHGTALASFPLALKRRRRASSPPPGVRFKFL